MSESLSDTSSSPSEKDPQQDAFLKGFSKGRRKALKNLLKSLGVESVEQLQQRIEEHESLVKKREDLQRQLEVLKLEREAERERARQESSRLQIHRALEETALKEGLLRLEDLESIGTDGITIDLDGTVQGVEELFSSLKREKPHLFRNVPDVTLLDNTRPNGRTLCLDEMGYQERAELYRRNPALYRKLTGN